MNAAERAEIARALELDGEASAAAIRQFTSAEQLHQWLLRYNVNDGLLPCVALARHPRCDRGTAHRLYWQFHELLCDEEERAGTQQQGADRNVDALLTILEERFARSDFRSSELRFDPVEWLSLDERQQAEMVEAGLPRERLEVVGERELARERLD